MVMQFALHSVYIRPYHIPLFGLHCHFCYGSVMYALSFYCK